MAACRRQLLLPLCLATLFCYGVVSGLRELSTQCGSQKYEIPSTYAINVDRLLSKLRDEAIAGNSFSRVASVTLGASDTDGVSGRAVCYTDHSRQECAECLMEAVPRFGDKCPNARNASLFYEACLLFYYQLIPSSQHPYGSVVTDSLGLDLTGSDAAATSFSKQRDLLLGDLRDRAISSGQYAATNSIQSAAGSIYGLVQCVLSLSEEQCRLCLTFLILSVNTDRRIQNMTIGALKGYWCYIRYETNQFNDYISEYMVSPTRAPATAPEAAPAMAPTRPPPPRQGLSRRGTLIGVASCSVFFVTTIALLWCLFRQRISRLLGTESRTKITWLGSLTPKQFSVSQLKAATNNFSDPLGSGAFGTVYKGTIGGKEVAVKKLRNHDGVGATAFASEASILMAFKHKNLVKLLGYCDIGEDRLLCFEYLSGGSLDKLIYEDGGGLDWSGRYKIVQGICSGLHYLHHELDQEQNIVHLDLKASNVLISRGEGGEITCVKIADFGLSRFFRAYHAHSYTQHIVGPREYMAPEYLSKGRISPKADIYSFGVLILEIVTGRHAIVADDSSGDFIAWVRGEWSQGDIRTLMYPTDLPGDCIKQARNCVEIALDCVKEDPNIRPDAEKIRQRLSQV